MSHSLSGKSSRSIANIALFAALIAAMGLIPKLDLSFGVPITLQTLGVMMTGCLLGAKNGFRAVILFLLIVALGVPLLAGGRGGLGVFLAPSAGFLIGWPLGAAVSGWLMQRLWHLTGWALVVGAFASAFAGGIAVVYACGVVGLASIAKLTVGQALWATAAFLPGDLIKCAVCAVAVQTIARGLPRWRLTDQV